jgi:hypothetical protein
MQLVAVWFSILLAGIIVLVFALLSGSHVVMYVGLGMFAICFFMVCAADIIEVKPDKKFSGES